MNRKKCLKYIKYISLCLIAATQIFPLYWLVTFSLKGNTEIFGNNIAGLPHVWKWDNYMKAFTQTSLLQYFFNSVFYSAVTVIVAGILSAMAAYAISRMFWKLKGVVFALFTLGIMVPAQVLSSKL